MADDTRVWDFIVRQRHALRFVYRESRPAAPGCGDATPLRVVRRRPARPAVEVTAKTRATRGQGRPDHD